MRVHRSNRVERLFDALVGVVSEPLPNPLESECIVVSSRGMNTWLSMQLSERLGVWAGGRFPFPRRFVDDLFGAIGPHGPAWRDAQQLLWPILAELPAHLDNPAFEELARFVRADTSGRNLFQLANRVASMFDQYPVFRPEMVLGWDAGADEQWQAILWRAVLDRLANNGGGGSHVAAQARDFIDALEAGERGNGLPSRVCVFGVSTLPPFYVHILNALDKVVPVHLFIVSPSQEYWAEVQSRRRRAQDAADAPETPLADGVPPLLVSLGAVGREFQGVLETVDYQEPPSTLYQDPGRADMLHALQADLLHLRSDAQDAHHVAPDDRSLTLHACHSPMREVEVLHDQLLALLAQDATLQPRDIVVLLTDVEVYAPLVEAVFEREERAGSFIPYCVADRSVRAENPLIEAFHRVLDTAGSRLPVSEVLDLLTLSPVQERFDIGSESLDAIATWVADAGIRWGIDGAHRHEHKQPALEENTWRFGLRRLLLGFAMPGGGTDTYAGVLPHDEIEGADAQLLGRFADFCEALFATSQRLTRARSPGAWQTELLAVIDLFLVDPEGSSAWEVQPLRTAIDAVAKEASAAKFEEPLALEAMVELVETRLEAEAPARGFLARGVTFCAMLPMRSVPFRVVCMLGLSDGAFPRGDRRLGFDLLAESPKPGDRSRRADDRYLFLEAIMAARECVHLSYVGQSIQDNADLPPSVVLGDFLEQVERSLVPPEDDAPGHVARATTVLDHIRVRHPMQPFSPRYFGADPDPRLFSYADEYCESARVLRGRSMLGKRPPLLTAALPDPREDPAQVQEVDILRLLRFMKAPVGDFLKRRLGVYLEDTRQQQEDREPMELDGLQKWTLGSRILEHGQHGLPAETSAQLVRAEGLLPLGTPGLCRHEEISRNVAPLLARVERLREGAPQPNLTIDLQLRHPSGTTRVTGTVDALWGTRRSQVTYSKLQPKHRIELWIRHLCLCASTSTGYESTFVARGTDPGVAQLCTFAPVPEATAEALLADIVELYWTGQREPVLLLPQASFAYCKALDQTGGDPDAALASVRKQWSGHINFERDDPHVRRLVGDDDVLAPGYSPFGAPLSAGDFAQVATRMLGPMLEATR